MFRYFDLFHLVESSLVITLGSAALSLLIGVPAGYALARSRSRDAVAHRLFLPGDPHRAAGRHAYPVLPDDARHRPARHAGGRSILINATLNSAFVVWMMFSYFRSLPKELEEAALTDGCTLARRLLPRRAAARRARASWRARCSASCSRWNDFLYSAFLTRSETKPISVALLAAYGTKDITWGTLGALAHFSTIPIVLIALMLNRYFVQGLTRGVA